MRGLNLDNRGEEKDGDMLDDIIGSGYLNLIMKWEL